jgi:formimidoylglutamase
LSFELKPTDIKKIYWKDPKSDIRLCHWVQALSKLEKLKADSINGKNNGKKPLCLIGVEDDRGIGHNQGRRGAKAAPKEIRRQFFKMTPPFHLEPSSYKCSILDLGDIPPHNSIEETHEALSQAVKMAHQKNYLPVVLGGGHDHAYGEIKGCSQSLMEQKWPKGAMPKNAFAVLNCDAHLDVRERKKEITSGTPFRRAVEDPEIHLEGKNYWAFALQYHCNSHQHWQWMKDKKAKMLTLEACRQKKGVDRVAASLFQKLRQKNLPFVFSMDMDCVRISDAPGVSAPQSDGVTAREMIKLGRLLHGERTSSQQNHPIKGLQSIGIYEVSPPLDVDQRTSKLAARFLYALLFGI